MTDKHWLCEAMTVPEHAVVATLSAAVAARWPARFRAETDDTDIEIDTFLERVPCEVKVHAAPAPVIATDWHQRREALARRLEIGHRTVVWEGQTFDVVRATWTSWGRPVDRTWFVCDAQAPLDRLLEQIARVTVKVREDDEVMVFAGGCWSRSEELRAAIRGASFDNLVLAPGLAEGLLADFEDFLGARADYVSFGVPWKRGVLLLGPPGNGKTHCLKALVNRLRIPCLYVQSFASRHGDPRTHVRDVFERARRTTPCLLVLEDLDSLLTDATRAYFLNELDGFAANEGILTVATTNHPERLDPAILDRPSRFDRKYHFGLPEHGERGRYLELWNRNLPAEARLEAETVARLAQATTGFSFAYLKELVLSSLVAWMAGGRTAALAQVTESQLEALRQQMVSDADEVRAFYVEERSPWDDDE